MNNVVNGVSLLVLDLAHTKVIFQLTWENRAYLRQWLPWLDTVQAPEDTENFIQSCIRQHQSGLGATFVVYAGEKPCGVAGYHKLSKSNRSGALGYWLAEPYTGQGIMTSAVRQLLKIGFQNYGLHRIEIRCAEQNARSWAIPQRLGFVYEGTLRDAEWLYDHFVNHRIYSLLRAEFQ